MIAIWMKKEEEQYRAEHDPHAANPWFSLPGASEFPLASCLLGEYRDRPSQCQDDEQILMLHSWGSYITHHLSVWMSGKRVRGSGRWKPL
jgi:hypothetical protein